MTSVVLEFRGGPDDGHTQTVTDAWLRQHPRIPADQGEYVVAASHPAASRICADWQPAEVWR